MIDIFSNTLLKLIFRNGPDSDRKNVILTNAEPGYASDTKRLWVGDGATKGGVIAGNINKGSATDITSLAPLEIGDTGYDSDDKKLYRVKTGSGSQLSDWELIGGVYSPGAGITISTDNTISVTGFATIAARYNGITNTTVFSKGIASIQKVGTGFYRVNYIQNITNPIPSVTIVGTNLTLQSTVSLINNTTCEIRVGDVNGNIADAEIFVQIGS